MRKKGRTIIVAAIAVMMSSVFVLNRESFINVILGVGTVEGAEAIPEIPTKGMVTMVDLGSKKCIPCKMMAPILEELMKDYKGRASIVFIDVWQHKDQAEKYKVKAIPTQIFFDKDGKEVERHVGFMDKKGIVEKLTRLGVSNPG